LNVNTKRGEVYSLSGVVVHSGTSSECGHYYSYARHSLFCDPEIICDSLETRKSEDDFDFLQDKWYLFNDSRVSYATYSSFCDVTQRFTKDTAYVLFYKRIDPKNAEKQEIDLNSSLRVSDIDAPLRTDLRAAISKDNAMYLKVIFFSYTYCYMRQYVELMFYWSVEYISIWKKTIINTFCTCGFLKIGIWCFSLSGIIFKNLYGREFIIF